VFGVVEQPLVVDAGDRADDRAVVVAYRDQIRHRITVGVVVPNYVDPCGHHAAAHVQAVHLVGVVASYQWPQRDSRRRPGQTLVGEAQPIGVAGVDEQLVRRACDEDVGLAGVYADVAPASALAPKHFGEVVRVAERLTEDQPTPAQVEHHVIGHGVGQVRRRHVVQPERDRLGMVITASARFRCQHPIDTTGVVGFPRADAPQASSGSTSSICLTGPVNHFFTDTCQ
jgi:hypothetical protein